MLAFRKKRLLARLHRAFGKPKGITEVRDRIAYQALWTSRFSAFVSLVAVVLSAVVAFVAISSLKLNSITADQARLSAQSQVDANRKLADAAARQAEASIEGVRLSRDNLIAAQRAWVGPRNARSDAAPEAGKPVTVFLDYQNTGREPAIETAYDLDFFVSSIDGEAVRQVDHRVAAFQSKCKLKWTPNQATVVFPSGLTGSSYTLNQTLAGDNIDQEVIDGAKALIFSGCGADCLVPWVPLLATS